MTDRANRRPTPFWDAPVTIALLLVGLYIATTSFAQAPDTGAIFDSYLVSAGVGHYTLTELATGTAYAGAGSELLSLLLAIGFSVPRLRAHRRAFWIPLVSGLIGFVLATVFNAIALFSDPAVMTYITAQH